METTRYLQKRAKEGDADAQFRLGYRLAFGRQRSLPTNWESVVAWWQQAAAAGDCRAQFYLGTCFDRGHGVAQSFKRAMAMYRKAAEQGHRSAQYNLAFGYREGIGVSKNLTEAFRWFKLAAQAGDGAAQRDLGYCYHEGTGVAVDLHAAIHWYKKAARAGDAKAQYNLGLSYLDGDGVPCSVRWATFWFAKAAAQGHFAAKERLKAPGQESGGPLTKIHVELPGDDSFNGESFWARPVGKNLYELQNSPWFARDLHFGDVVKAIAVSDDEKPCIVKVVRRSGHKTLRVVFGKKTRPRQRKQMLQYLRKWQASYEKAWTGFYALDVEPEGDYQAVCDQLWAWEQQGKLEYETGMTIKNGE
jgi:uncharacterized protein